jgi:uncharacterized protein
MYLYRRYVDDELAGISDVPLSPLLAGTGEEFERGQLTALLEARVDSVGPADSALPFDERWQEGMSADIERFQDIIRELSTGDRRRPVVFYQPPLEGDIGAWPVRGDADVVIATSTDGAPSRPRAVEIRIAELKSSSEVQTNHQLQAAMYALLVEGLLVDVEISVSASIVSQDPVRPDLSSVVTASGGVDLRRLKTFDLSSRKNDVQLLLELDGTLDDILLRDGEMRSEGSPPTFRIDARCDGCSKQAKCLAYAVTNHDLAVLGLTEGTQQSLRSHGVENLRDIGELYDYPAASGERRATSHTHPQPRNPDLITRILRETDVSNLQDRAQIAHRFLREIDPSYEAEWEAHADGTGPWSDYLIGKGRNLPHDDPPAAFDLGYPNRSLVRVYPYVQHDFVRNRIVLLAAKVTCTRYENDHGDGVFVSARPEGLPKESDDDKDSEERRLLEDFFEQLSDAINAVRPDLSDEGYDSTEGFLHMYPYGNGQRRALVDAVKRHPDSEAAQAIRTLLGYRGDIDQEVVSVLRDEFRERHALRYPGLGLVQTVAQFFAGDGAYDWESHRDTGATPLKKVFALDLFETAVPYDEAGNRILMNFTSGLKIPPDNFTGYYPVVNRNQENLPLEYIYSTEEFDVITPEWAEDDEMRERIIRYRHHTDADSSRVTLDDIDDIVRAICEAYEHIERCIRDKDASTEKNELNLADLRENSLGVSELQSTCLEYQDLEWGSTRRSLESHYRTALSQRVATGKAVPFEITDAPDDEDDERQWISGSILRSLGGGRSDGTDPDTPLSLEQGSFVVLSELTRDGDGNLTEAEERPTDIAHNVLGRIQRVDTRAGDVRVTLVQKANKRAEPFRPHRVGWTTDPDDEWGRQLIGEGMAFVLDPALDDISANRANLALQLADQNDVHNRLVNLYDEEQPDALQVEQPLFDPDAVETFIGRFDEVMPHSTNRDQQSFVRQVDHTVAALQGPPGTGKTAYASAPAILARAFATDSPAFAGVVTAHSNNAVDEVATKTGEALERLQNRGVLEGARLIRVRSTPPKGNLPSNVPEYQYYDDSEELQQLFEDRVVTSSSPGPLIVFTTPVTLRNLVHAVRWTIDDDADDVEELLADGRARLFDFALIDEASMMDLPLLFLVGAFLGVDKQLLLVGDHRQMQPIQQHDWEAEDRQTIEEHTPAVSTLDFIRFLRGEKDSKFEQLDRERPTWHDPNAVLPMDRLRVSYRLPPAMARFESELFYHLDDITLESRAEALEIPDVRDGSLPDWLNAALDLETRVTVLLHDDDVFTKDSPVEAYLAERVLGELPVVDVDPSADQLTGGIVVPFRLMRRRLLNRVDVTVDTVERFQGGERDVMVLAMTAGNQGYVNRLSEFLLDANRFNVGASRMKRKLFMVVSKSLFQAVSPDPAKYEQQKAWKQLYQRLIAGESPVSIFELTDAEIPELDSRSVMVEVYTGYQD